MIDTSQIKEHMEIVGSDGQHVGTVDRVDGQRIKLTRKDASASGEHPPGSAHNRNAYNIASSATFLGSMPSFEQAMTTNFAS